MYQILSDGLPHKKRELHGCLYDDMGALRNIQTHISLMRRQLRPLGMDILCELVNTRCVCYRLVRLLASATNGRR
jgi:hypothetical protein